MAGESEDGKTLRGGRACVDVLLMCASWGAGETWRQHIRDCAARLNHQRDGEKPSLALWGPLGRTSSLWTVVAPVEYREFVDGCAHSQICEARFQKRRRQRHPARLSLSQTVRCALGLFRDVW